MMSYDLRSLADIPFGQVVGVDVDRVGVELSSTLQQLAAIA